jgi:predicted glycosyltransferase
VSRPEHKSASKPRLFNVAGLETGVSVLIDISHPAHVHFFRPLAESLLADGVKVRIVARDKDVTVRLLEAAGLDFELLPMGRPGSGSVTAATELIRRASALRSRIHDWRTRVVLTRNPSGVLAARGTRAASVFDTDDGRGVGVHYWTARPFADLITSSIYDPERHGRAHRRYRALKAHMFLHPRSFTADLQVRRKYLSDEEMLSVARFSAHDASHDRRIVGLTGRGRLGILARLQAHGSTLVSIERKGLHLHRRIVHPGSLEDSGCCGIPGAGSDVAPEDFHDLLASASLFVGDSQSVAAEAAILGVPALRLSGFTGRAFYLSVLEERGLMKNYRPGEENLLLDDMESTLAMLPERVAATRRAAAELNDDSEDLHDWFRHHVTSFL